MVMQEPNRKGISAFGAVNIRNGKLITKITDRYNALTFLEFLSTVHARFPDSILVLDNAMYHHAGIITDYAFLIGVDLLFLPSYSPKLNPIERVWKLVKKNANHNRYFQLLSDLGGALVGEFSKYSKPNRELTKLGVIT
ncbi:MAG: transposase [Thermoplasmataceae archaeon]